MLIVLSPAKRLNWDIDQPSLTTPQYQDHALALVQNARALSLGELKTLMHLSDDLAKLNRDRFAAFSAQPEPQTTRPALFAFAGDTYVGFDAQSLSAPQREEAQARLRILSGLYGVLRPLDAIQPYRLEMGSKLNNEKGTTLYAYWGSIISDALAAQAELLDTQYLLNCASQEYFKAAKSRHLPLKVITPKFLDEGPKGPRMIGFYAKKARGALARWMIDNTARTPEELTHFDALGYRFVPEQSTHEAPVFIRAASAKS